MGRGEVDIDIAGEFWGGGRNQRTRSRATGTFAPFSEEPRVLSSVKGKRNALDEGRYGGGTKETAKEESLGNRVDGWNSSNRGGV